MTRGCLYKHAIMIMETHLIYYRSETDAGFLVRDTVVFVCEILDCCPWFEFSDLEVSPYGIACLCVILSIQLLLDRCQIFLSLAPFFLFSFYHL